MINWAITGGCNSKCIFCEVPFSTSKDVPLQRMHELIDEMMSHMPVRGFHLVGGEPFVRKDIWDILAYLHKRKAQVTVTSNATFVDRFTPPQLEILRKAVGLLRISIDSADPPQNDELRGVPGTTERVMKSIHILLQEKRPDLAITTVVMNKNLTQIPHLCRLAARLGIFSLEFQPISPISIFNGTHAIESKIDLVPRMPVEWECLNRVIDEGITEAKRYGLQTNLPTFKLYAVPYFRSLGQSSNGLFQKELMSDFRCMKINRSMFVDFDGATRPSSILSSQVGNVKQESAQQLWNKLGAFRYDEKKGELPDACKYCFCHTGENLRASALLSPWKNRKLLSYLLKNDQI